MSNTDGANVDNSSAGEGDEGGPTGRNSLSHLLEELGEQLDDSSNDDASVDFESVASIRRQLRMHQRIQAMFDAASSSSSESDAAVHASHRHRRPTSEGAEWPATSTSDDSEINERTARPRHHPYIIRKVGP